MGTVETVTVGGARTDLTVRWDGQSEAYPVMGADVAPYNGSA